MKCSIGIIVILITLMINSLSLFASKINEYHFNRSYEYKKLSFVDEINSISLFFLSNERKPAYLRQSEYINASAYKKFPVKIENLKSYFSLVKKDSNAFSISISPDKVVASEDNKSYFKPALEISRINVIVWAFDKYVLNASWANISLKTISENIKHSYSWDYGDFATNYFGHAYHGAMYHSVSRFHGLSFIESTIYTLLGSLTWEFFWESEFPSKNDSIISTLGGMALGEALFKISDLVTDKNSTGFGRILRKSLKFLINPAVGIKEFTDKAYKTENFPGNHYFSLRLPFGAYRSSDNKSCFLIAPHLEYKDVFKKDNSKINPYDWFLLDARLGLNDNGFMDPEIYTSGVLFGRKFNKGVAGLFALFDYIDTHTVEKMSMVGVGPGFVICSNSDSKLFFNSQGVLSFGFGGSSASIDFEDPSFDKEPHGPYHFGPGILGRIKLELGKDSLGSIHTRFSQYWVHSLVADANEFMSIISFDLNYDLSKSSQISLGYDYYLRNANLQDQRLGVSKNAVRAMYVLNF